MVITWDKVAKVPVDWVSPKKRSSIKMPEAKTPTKIIKSQEDFDICLIFLKGSPLK